MQEMPETCYRYGIESIRSRVASSLLPLRGEYIISMRQGLLGTWTDGICRNVTEVLMMEGISCEGILRYQFACLASRRDWKLEKIMKSHLVSALFGIWKVWLRCYLSSIPSIAAYRHGRIITEREETRWYCGMHEHRIRSLQMLDNASSWSEAEHSNRRRSRTFEIVVF